MYPQVMVLSDQQGQGGPMVELLQRLGVETIVEARSGEQAVSTILLQGGVDAMLCDLNGGGLTTLEFLHGERQLHQVRALVLCGDLEAEECRRVLQIVALTGLQFLGALTMPLQASTLQKALQRYRHHGGLRPALALQSHKLLSEWDVRRGLALGEFTIWLQPKLDMRTNALLGVEALARWEHPGRGLLLPQDFLAAVLAYDLIDEMFRQLLEQGLKLLQGLRRGGRVLEIAFNLHASQLSQASLVDHIGVLLDRYALPSSVLMFELAENGLLDIPKSTHKHIHRLHQMGCKLAIDDFGVGFTSLKQLCQFPITQLMLGSEFTEDLSVPRNRTVVLSALAIAESLEVQLVAKGIGTEVARDNLLAMGCTLGQGFYFARPMPVSRFVQWLMSLERDGGSVACNETARHIQGMPDNRAANWRRRDNKGQR